jgi:hypothetical protein
MPGAMPDAVSSSATKSGPKACSARGERQRRDRSAFGQGERQRLSLTGIAGAAVADRTYLE